MAQARVERATVPRSQAQDTGRVMGLIGWHMGNGSRMHLKPPASAMPVHWKKASSRDSQILVPFKSGCLGWIAFHPPDLESRIACRPNFEEEKYFESLVTFVIWHELESNEQYRAQCTWASRSVGAGRTQDVKTLNQDAHPGLWPGLESNERSPSTHFMLCIISGRSVCIVVNPSRSLKDFVCLQRRKTFVSLVGFRRFRAVDANAFIVLHIVQALAHAKQQDPASFSSVRRSTRGPRTCSASPPCPWSRRLPRAITPASARHNARIRAPSFSYSGRGTAMRNTRRGCESAPPTPLSPPSDRRRARRPRLRTAAAASAGCASPSRAGTTAPAAGPAPGALAPPGRGRRGGGGDALQQGERERGRGVQVRQARDSAGCGGTGSGVAKRALSAIVAGAAPEGRKPFERRVRGGKSTAHRSYLVFRGIGAPFSRDERRQARRRDGRRQHTHSGPVWGAASLVGGIATENGRDGGRGVEPKTTAGGTVMRSCVKHGCDTDTAVGCEPSGSVVCCAAVRARQHTRSARTTASGWLPRVLAIAEIIGTQVLVKYDEDVRHRGGRVEVVTAVVTFGTLKGGRLRAVAALKSLTQRWV
ncbi:hypothetical protein GGX14DRAFT_409244 [Mycena pura]|uniref:Uncharacterized protein n=1 Tax=Mycena pura TaxID=153505 RepID=A0AAD6UNR4_9AGAR|nr:hypothetical protein GGX14DRAFT_409244 [Mycena pura]